MFAYERVGKREKKRQKRQRGRWENEGGRDIKRGDRKTAVERVKEG